MGNHVTFDRAGYIAALQFAIGKAFDVIERRVYREILANLASLKIVEMDKPHATAIAHALRTARRRTTTQLIASFGAGGDPQPNQTFRAVYYEYGTGTKMEPARNWKLGGKNWNPHRPKSFKAPLYARPKGKWVDEGGNERESHYRGKKPMQLKGKAVTEREVQAEHWFAWGLYRGTADMDILLLDAVKSVPLSPYIRLRGIQKRM